MAFTPYDWNQSIQHREDYVADRLREGSPVVGLRYAGGVALVTLRRSQRKVFEIYDRLMFAGLGSQSDIEAVRVAAIDFAHQEGFRRSPDDVTIQRVVGFALSPALKRQFADPFHVPAIIRGLFAEVGQTPEDDRLYLLDHDGEFEVYRHYACAAATVEQQERMAAYAGRSFDASAGWESAVALGLRTWAVGRLPAVESEDDGCAGGATGAAVPVLPDEARITQALAEGLRDLQPEVGLLERDAPRESKFRLVPAEEIPRPG
ncbi:MAG TPA: hypothetical protein PLQ54_14950 [Armatimonadota bacterium]|nr:hypothetical protein [Armatimonadota bacterium]